MGQTSTTTQSATPIQLGLPCFLLRKQLAYFSPKEFWSMFADTVFSEDNNTHVLTEKNVKWSDHQLRLVMLNMAQQIHQQTIWPHWAQFTTTLEDKGEFSFLGGL